MTRSLCWVLRFDSQTVIQLLGTATYNFFFKNPATHRSTTQHTLIKPKLLRRKIKSPNFRFLCSSKFQKTACCPYYAAGLLVFVNLNGVYDLTSWLNLFKKRRERERDSLYQKNNKATLIFVVRCLRYSQTIHETILEKLSKETTRRNFWENL